MALFGSISFPRTPRETISQSQASQDPLYEILYPFQDKYGSLTGTSNKQMQEKEVKPRQLERSKNEDNLHPSTAGDHQSRTFCYLRLNSAES